MYTIYMSSTKYHWWNFKSYSWKKNLQKRLKDYCVYFIDPLVFESEDPVVADLDIKDIEKSDLVVVYIDKITIGTLLELAYCIHKKKQYLILSYKQSVLKHPWILNLCRNHICNSMDMLINYIHKITCLKKKT